MVDILKRKLLNPVKYIMAQRNIMAEEEYGEDVTFHINMKRQDFELLKKQITDATGGKATFGEPQSTAYKEKIEK